MTYEYTRYATDSDNLMSTLKRFGVAVIPNVLNENECLDMQNGMWDTLECISSTWSVPINRNEEKSWREIKNLHPKRGVLIREYGIGHAQYAWDIRQNPKVAALYTRIWNHVDGCNYLPEDLLVSMDGVAYSMPPEITNCGWFHGKSWLHCNQSFTESEFKGVQSWITSYDINEGDATLTFLEGSHTLHSEFRKNFPVSKDNWHKLDDKEYAFYTENGCEHMKIKCPKGSMVLWDSRTIHSGAEVMKGRSKQNFQNIVYICYEPRSHCNQTNLKKRINTFENQRNTTHCPCKPLLTGKTPRTFGQKLPEITTLPRPTLTPLGTLLIGYNPHPKITSHTYTHLETAPHASTKTTPSTTPCSKCSCRAKYCVDSVLLCGRHCKPIDRSEQNMCN